jgi:SPP1 gp7 family putative phage head morphogenesis protein
MEELAQFQREKSHWRRTRAAEDGYARKLRRVGEHIGRLIDEVVSPVATITQLHDAVTRLTLALRRYADVLEPWAQAAAGQLINEVAARDFTAWTRAAKDMGKDLDAELANAPIGARVEELVRSHVGLIKSLPLEAAERVQTMSLASLRAGERIGDIVRNIMTTGEVTKARATLIAKTETGRAATAITQARAEHVGSDSYTWLSARDGAVRRMHKLLDGQTFRWNDPPVAEDNGARHHPGEFPNCRCVAIPVIPVRPWE